MKWQNEQTDFLTIEDKKIEYCTWGPPPDAASTIILVHEGLGSVSLWKDFPRQLAEATGYGVFAYSRFGYGKSSPASLPRPLDYMSREAIDILPKVLEAIGFKNGILLGHSDGASIATLYGGNVEDYRVRGLCLIAPHFFTEETGLTAIAEKKAEYDDGKLEGMLARYHDNPENTFRGWNDAWLDPGFKDWNIEDAISYLRIPVMAIQGKQDQYGTIKQIEALESGTYSPCDVALLNDCKHSPHLEKTNETVEIVADFLNRLDHIEETKVEIA